ncbi:hypothetical protein MLD38_037463 [Melastoma candidum]|uniref:Uncharacterized protein n=1 Tax=Melastoma candidum TaxID=119954 RepID=A0ACB9LM60_9MYRT|nr:hypothetical protein MLD38_037463 [Melastoma candidum]
MPGLTGGNDDTYVTHMLIRARNKGWCVVVFNSRGCADSPVTTPQFYSASITGDRRGVVRHVSTRYPKANIYAVGWSLGGNILVRYLGELAFYLYVVEASFRKVELNLVQGFAMFERNLIAVLSGAESLCNPFNLIIADEDFRKDMGGEYNIPLAVNVKTVKDFDEGLTRGGK